MNRHEMIPDENSVPRDENFAEGSERAPIIIDDGMGMPIEHPKRLTAENFQQVFGPALPEGLDPEIFERGGSMEFLSSSE